MKIPVVHDLLQRALHRLRTLLALPTGYRDEAQTGLHVGIGPDCVIIRSSIGDYSYIGNRSVIAHARLGRYCSIASEVHIGSGSHPSRNTVSTHPVFYLSQHERGWDFVEQDTQVEFRPTIVGNDVWIGAKALIRDGVVIGDGAIIGAGAIVVRDVEPYAVYGGVPARLIRYRFPEETIAWLMAFQWWERSPEWLRANVHAFSDIDNLRRLDEHV